LLITGGVTPSDEILTVHELVSNIVYCLWHL